MTELDNRFSTLTEVRRVAWPNYEKPEWSEQVFLQGISGTLELFHLSTVRFQTIVGQVNRCGSVRAHRLGGLLSAEMAAMGLAHRNRHGPGRTNGLHDLCRIS